MPSFILILHRIPEYNTVKPVSNIYIILLTIQYEKFIYQEEENNPDVFKIIKPYLFKYGSIKIN
jgi:hypothetical protein